MGKPDAPTPPNPLQTAAAATGTNVSTAIANSFLQNQNQITPDGSLRYDVTGNYGWTDPTTGSTYNIPTFTSTQSLSPQSEAIKSQTDAAKMNLAGMANSQSARVSNMLGTPFNPLANAPGRVDASDWINKLPAAATSFNAGGPLQTSLGNYGQQQTAFGGAGDITQSYGPQDDFSSDRQRVEDSLMARMNPQLAIEKQGIQQQLADQGIRYGSQAYSDAMMNYSRQANDARFGAVSQAGQEQQRMMDMAAQRAGFQNSAQQQAYQQAQGRGQFANDAQQQAYQQMLGAGGFANQAQGQQFQQNAALGTFQNAGLAQEIARAQASFNAAQSQRNQYMQEQYAQRNQPLNEISALMSGSQVQQPNWLNQPGAQIPTTDVAGIINQGFQNQLGIYNAQNQNYQSLAGGVLGLGGKLGAAAIQSDRRSKENIDRIATVFAASSKDGEAKQLPIYSYSYKDDPASTKHIGPMAQDVEQITPEAVEQHGGRKFIKPHQVMGSILRAS